MSSMKRYKDGPTMKKDEETGRPKVGKREEAADKVQEGMDGVKMEEKGDMHARHSLDRHMMHAKHEHEHLMHKEGGKEEMHGRHEKEHKEMHGRHEKEMHGETGEKMIEKSKEKPMNKE